MFKLLFYIIVFDSFLVRSPLREDKKLLRLNGQKTWRSEVERISSDLKVGVEKWNGYAADEEGAKCQLSRLALGLKGKKWLQSDSIEIDTRDALLELYFSCNYDESYLDERVSSRLREALCNAKKCFSTLSIECEKVEFKNQTTHPRVNKEMVNLYLYVKEIHSLV